jgi:short chain dehydrogenase/Galactose-1-phosphate uridyl transferase, N-terminal domain
MSGISRTGGRPCLIKYVFVFENRGRQIGATIDHPHSQVMAFTMIPPIATAELSSGKCELCQGADDDLVVIGREDWQAAVPWAPSWPYEMLLSPRRHVPDLPAAGPELRAGLGAILVEALTRMERLLGRDTPWPGASPRIRPLYVLINNAGIALTDDLTDPAAIERHLAVNLFGTYAVTQAFLPALSRSRGAIVIGSTSQARTNTGQKRSGISARFSAWPDLPPAC